MLKGHGDNGYLYKNKIIADFSSNVYFKGPSKELLKHLEQSIHKIGNYPEVAGESLNRLLAKQHNLNYNNILVTNGATEAFYMMAQLFSKAHSCIFVPSFAEYEDACTSHRHKIDFIENSVLDKGFQVNTDVVWLCNPNNPDGKITEPDTILQMCMENKKTTFIIDEAYIDFLLKDISVASFVNEYPNLIVVKSLTKKYAIPGLRLGYIIAHDSIIENLLKIKMPWSVNRLALDAGLFLAQNEDKHFNKQVLISHSSSLQEEISQIKGIDVISSETSYFLVKSEKPSKIIFDYLLEEHGLLVRNASNFRSLGENYIRICTQDESKNRLLIEALKQWTS